MEKKVNYLVVDTTAFIENAQLQNVGQHIVTCQDVVDEITNKRQLRRLVVLPYDLEVKNVDPENIRIVTEFSKKTGDYTSLSATDIKVMALSYQLEKEHVGVGNIRTEPVVQRTVNIITKPQPLEMSADVTGFYIPQKSRRPKLNSTSRNVSEDDVSVNDTNIDNIDDEDDNDIKEMNSCQNADFEKLDKDLLEKFGILKCEDAQDLKIEDVDNILALIKEKNEIEDVDNILASINEKNDGGKCSLLKEQEIVENNALNEDGDGRTEDDDEDEDEEYEDEDDEGWITPSNIQKAKKQINSEFMEEISVEVACMTTDFAMQNVLKQMNLNVAALDGRMIKQLKTYILRCYACFGTTSIMTKNFCPKCGNKTLKRVTVSLDENGKQQIHINGRRPLTARGKKFSLPKIQGGKHSNNPILVEDQPMPDQRPTRLARTKTNPLDDDYIAGYSPFVMRDVTSKSAQLKIRPVTEVKHWMQKNPNEVHRRRKK